MDYKWLLFDLDNTILDFNASSKLGFSSLLEKINPSYDVDALFPIYSKYNHQVWDEREAGLISHTELRTKRWRLFFDAANIDFDPLEANNHYLQFIRNEPFLIDGAITLLDKVVEKFDLMIITNGLSEVQWGRMRKMDIEKYFKHIIISDEIGSAKPAHAYFKHCDDLMNHPDKSSVLVIGDTLKSDIKGGNDFGYKTCWHNYYKEPNKSETIPDYTINTLEELYPILEV